MTTPAQQHNLNELVTALRAIRNDKGESPLSDEIEMLLDNGLHHAHLPPTLQPSAAEAFQLAFEAWGGVPHLVLFASKYPGAFLKLYARQTAQTIAPVIPPPLTVSATREHPPWLTARRLAYQESPVDMGVDAQDSSEE